METALLGITTVCMIWLAILQREPGFVIVYIGAAYLYYGLLLTSIK